MAEAFTRGARPVTIRESVLMICGGDDSDEC